MVLPLQDESMTDTNTHESHDWDYSQHPPKDTLDSTIGVTNHTEEDDSPAQIESPVPPSIHLQRARTAPLSTLRPVIDRQLQSEILARPHKTVTLPAQVDEPGLRASDRPGAARAAYSYQYFEDDHSSVSSPSEDEADIVPPLRQQSTFGKGASGGQKRRQAMQERSYSRVQFGNNKFETDSKVSTKDGRLRISISQTVDSDKVAKWLGKGVKSRLKAEQKPKERESTSRKDQKTKSEAEEVRRIASSLQKIPKPRLNIVIMVIGSRGDIQPFLRIGQILKKRGHRVRIATHPAFREFVSKDIGLDFFSVGGDPSELMAFMVKNPGLIPSFDTVRQGEIPRRRAAMAEMFEGFWRSCINATDDETDEDNMRMMGYKDPFVADAIIANPPSFAHVHIAERLGIPLHCVFTFPYTPTRQFPHPLANIRASKGKVDPDYVNYMSYALVDLMTWQGLGDLVNSFRVKTLGLEPISSLWAAEAMSRMRIPYSYAWSPALVPKPADWGPEIDITGFIFLDLASNFKPPDDLAKFLEEGEPPVYIGFGSIVVDDADKFTALIFEAIKKAGVRALVSKGWGGFGGGGDVPDGVMMLENTPHDWLFPRCSAVVHHGGAGTTAAGLKCGKPTVIVPFFGDQPFWGAMVADNNAGAKRPIPYKNLTADRLAEAIKQCHTDEARENAQRIAKSIEAEGDGAENAVRSFENSLPLAGHHNMRCSILEERAAVWRLKRSNLRLSALAAEILVEQRKLKWSQLQLLRIYEYDDFDGPGDPISGVGGAVVRSVHGVGTGVGGIPFRMKQNIRKRKEYKRQSEKEAKRQQNALQQADLASPESSSTRSDALYMPEGGSTLDDSERVSSTHQSLAQELAIDAGTGLRQSASALLWTPLNIHRALAQGFHNAPRLYGDNTVRKQIPINSFMSGVGAAGHELFFDVYDAVTGLVIHPVRGAMEGDGVGSKIGGFWAGMGIGFGGAVLKPLTAAIAPLGHLGQGFRKEIQRHHDGPTSRGNHWIRRARIVQGRKEVELLLRGDDGCGAKRLGESRKRVDDGWDTMKQVWSAATAEAQLRGAVLGPWEVYRERKRWERAGALENVTATRRALDKAQDKEELRRYFAQREREMRVADQPQGFEQRRTREAGVGVGKGDSHEARDVMPQYASPIDQGTNGQRGVGAEEGREEQREEEEEEEEEEEQEKLDGEDSDDAKFKEPMPTPQGMGKVAVNGGRGGKGV